MALPTAVRYEMPTEFPQNRSDWTLDPSRAVLLLHDMQEYFVNAYDRSVDPAPNRGSEHRPASFVGASCRNPDRLHRATR